MWTSISERRIKNSVIIKFTYEEISVIKQNAKLAMIGGRSQIYVNSADRKRKLYENQLTGQLGEAALSKYLTGTIEEYVKARTIKNQNRFSGDNGMDLPTTNCDIKTSKMRVSNEFNYHLWVRPKEYHANTRYYLGLVPDKKEYSVIIVGWVDGKSMPFVNGKYEVSEKDLNPLTNSE